MTRRFISALVIVLAIAAAAPAQKMSEELASRNRLYGEHATARNYQAALDDVDAMLAMPEIEKLPGARATLLYNRACLDSLLGRKAPMLESIRAAVAAGYTNYAQYGSDHDFDAFRADSEFKALLAEIRAEYAPRPLVWDGSSLAPAFQQTFDAADNADLARLRAGYGVERAVAGSRGDYEQLIAITQWVSRQWQHSPNQMASKGDPITILDEARAGGRFICRDYAIVTAGMAAAYGMKARGVNLLPADVETRSEAHAVAEVWLRSQRKWVIADGQFGIVPELDGRPLNAVELQAALAADRPVRCRGAENRCNEWKAFISPNLFYFKTAADQRRFDGRAGSMLILVPKGANAPRKFAGGNEKDFAGAVYTSNPAAFYKAP